jgi:hypothetical protein
MHDTKKGTTPTPLVFTRDELVIINNALNEVCHAQNFSEDEFQARIGYSRAKAQEVLKKIAKVLEA